MKDTEGQESVIQEITELRRKIRKLEQLRSSLWLRGEILDESERLYVSLAEQSSDPLYLLCDGRIEYVNSAFLKLFNLSRDEVQAPDFDFFSLIAPESLDFIEDRLQKAIRGEKLESPYAFSALTRSGRRIEIEASLCHIPYKGRIAIQGLFRAVSDEVEQGVSNWKIDSPIANAPTLKETVNNYQSFFENFRLGNYRSSPEGRLIAVNRAMSNLFGYASPDEMVNAISNIASQIYFKSEDRESFLHALEASGSIREMESRYCRKDGTPIWVLESAWAVRGRNGKTLFYEGIIEDITERKQTQEFYNLLEESSPAGIYISRNKRFALIHPKIFNTHILKFTGLNEKELLETDPMDLIHPNDRDRVRETAIKMLKGDHRISPFEFRIVDKDGRIRWLMETIRSIHLRGERAALGSYVDITDQKEAQQQLEELRASESSILASIPHAVFGLDKGKIIFVNDSVESVFGWKPAELIGHNMSVLYRTEDDYTKIENTIQLALEENPVYCMEMQTPCLHKSGKDILCRISVSRMGDLENHRLVATYEDITEHKKAEDDLKESERRLKDIINFLPDPTFVINSKGEVIAWNRAIEMMTAIKAADILGKGDYEYALPFYNQRRPILIDMVLTLALDECNIEDIYQNLKRQDHILLGESFIPNLDGKSVYLLGTAAALFDSKGNIVGAIQSLRDITEQRLSEKAQRELEAELLQAQKMEAIGTLAGGIAHDFNNLLMGIQGYTSLMLLGMDSNHPYFKKLKSIEEQVQSGADLARQLLGFARGGRYEVAPTDVNEIIQKTSIMFGRTKKEITVQNRLKDDIWLIEADSSQIEQVLLNLFVNAGQAMPGGGEIYISTENVYVDEAFVAPFRVKPGSYVKISVTDTGVGMDEKTRQRVFEPFFTTREMGRGTGLGLASAYGIVKGHGGIINVYSEKGHGTTFTIYLPASEVSAAEGAVDRDKLLEGTETILLVDDEETIIDVSREILEALGYKVYSAMSGKEALEIYRANMDQIDLVILDMIIPEMSGGDIFDALKEINPNVKVILSSGYSMNGQAVKIMERGCAAFIQKPFSMGELSQKVRGVLGPVDKNSAGSSRVVKLEFRKEYTA